MADFGSNRFASKNQEWETPDILFNKINEIYPFTCDVCADANNAKCAKYFTEQDNCLIQTFEGVNWMNPPFKNVKAFIKKAYDERHNAITACLTPSKTNTRWWHDYCMKGEIWFICGRPKFKGNIHGLPQPLAIVVFGTIGNGTVNSLYL